MLFVSCLYFPAAETQIRTHTRCRRASIIQCSFERAMTFMLSRCRPHHQQQQRATATIIIEVANIIMNMSKHLSASLLVAISNHYLCDTGIFMIRSCIIFIHISQVYLIYANLHGKCSNILYFLIYVQPVPAVFMYKGHTTEKRGQDIAILAHFAPPCALRRNI